MQLSALLMITSRTPRFNREDVATRVIPLHFAAPVFYKNEDRMQEELLDRRNLIMGDLLVLCRKVADKLDEIPTSVIPPSKTRISSFYEFGWAMHAVKDDNGQWLSPQWERIFEGMRVAQMRFVIADCNIVETVKEVVAEHGGSIASITPRQLFAECEAKTICGAGLPKTVNVFADRLYSLTEALLEIHRLKLERKNGHAGSITLSLMPIGEDKGEVVEDKRAKY
jgi:hypothetical protein